jgi:hypothetical protein
MRTDLLAFGGSALLALALVGLGHALGFGGGALPEWGWVAFVLLIDVAHVYSTLFRTYFDRQELKRHPTRYIAIPVAVYAMGVLFYQHSELLFWRVLAYIALFHFVRQQAGWVAVYRARARQGKIDAVVDQCAIYAATLYPVVYWHAHLHETQFNWFLQGDFVSGSWAQNAEPVAFTFWLLALFAFAARSIWLFRVENTVYLGKLVVVATTAAAWYVGIVLTNSDFDFTVTNVIIHGVPYMVLLWSYAKSRSLDADTTLTKSIALQGAAMFLVLVALFAYAEEWAWASWVHAEHSWLFPSAVSPANPSWLVFLVPLLALPQATHYALDGLLWRRKDTARNAAQRRALSAQQVPV